MLKISTKNHKIYLIGALTKETVSLAYYFKKKKNLTIDLKNLKELDYTGAVFLAELSDNHKIINLPQNFEKLYEFVLNNVKNLQIPTPKTDFFNHVINYILNIFTSIKENTINFLLFFGEFIYFFVYLITHPWKLRIKETAAIITKEGAGALPIIGLTSFLVGVVMAYQGAVQLSKFGANIFIVNMLGISIFREIGPLIAAIVVSGRSASSFSAEIGVMKLTDEIDAMNTLGFEPFWFLVIPRVVAMIIALPLIVFFADMIGILGGMLISAISLNIDYDMFLNRMRETLSLTQFFIGIGKTPFFGVIIALIGTYSGFQVKNSTQDIGKYTTKSVVNAIFWVIALDALFSVIFAKFGI